MIGKDSTLRRSLSGDKPDGGRRIVVRKFGRVIMACGVIESWGKRVAVGFLHVPIGTLTGIFYGEKDERLVVLSSYFRFEIPVLFGVIY